MSKWWNCDLQVATPAWQFTMPGDRSFTLTTEAGKRDFARAYMEALAEKGVEVIALADHNTGDWIDLMVDVGKEAGIVVFPGCEVTTGTGADGIHLLVIGDLTKTSLDFDRLLAGCMGFSDANPRFYTDGGQKKPGASPKTITQILDELPSDYLVIAPHACNENGIASGKTVSGSIRWKALQHERLSAVDPGDCANVTGDSFTSKFRRRELNHFPRLQDLAFVATSDAYRMEDLGRRFTWIRMQEPTLEALRQAFLDHEARILCSWSPRLAEYPDHNPNLIRHGWLNRVRLGGSLGNSEQPLEILLHPGMNVLIGGRGSGKSTVVAALRQLYSGFATLPESVREEAMKFADDVLRASELEAEHVLPISQEAQRARWTPSDGAQTFSSGQWVPTSFKVRVVNQKELFARVATDRDDPLAASRSLLGFVDESLGIVATGPLSPSSWRRRIDDAASTWGASARDVRNMLSDLEQLPAVRAEVHNLEGQVAAFDSDEARARRQSFEAILREQELLETEVASLVEGVRVLRERAEDVGHPAERPAQLLSDAQVLFGALDEIRENMRTQLQVLLDETLARIDEWRTSVDVKSWGQRVQGARLDESAYLAELTEQGIDPTDYSALIERLDAQRRLERSLSGKAEQLAPAIQRADRAWDAVLSLRNERLSQRRQLLDDVSGRSQRLSFELTPHADHVGWTRAVRELLNLRADAFLDDVPALARWLWDPSEGELQSERWRSWRDGLVSGDLSKAGARSQANLRPPFQKRLETLDEAVRLRLAYEIAEDVVEMKFLRDSGLRTNATDWQSITRGSPGQRTAAMLAFVLHHGNEPLVLDQPEDDLDTEWISKLVVRELRSSRWRRQIIVVSHNANIPVNGDAENVVVLENQAGTLRVRTSVRDVDGTGVLVPHAGAIENELVRADIQNIMEGGITAFVQRERKYNNEVRMAGGATN